ncbi:hypothetical protein [Maribacter forsetii]|uniref:hypothetical protein n=1 Tax=Maribacter forsetii TaxID=444515 RepID=UPI0005699649|nr:hypothetical protein [Maribacter forsetii]
MKTIKLFIYCISLIYCSEISAQSKWDISNQEDIKVYTPSDLKSNKIFNVYAYGPIEAPNEDLKNWVLETAKDQQKEIGAPLKKWIVKPEKEDYGITNSYKDNKGVTMQVAYQGGKLKDGRNFFLRLITSNDLITVLKYGARLDDLLVDIKADMVTRQTTATGKKSIASNNVNTAPTQTTTKEAVINEISETSLSPGKAPDGLVELRGLLGTGMQSTGMVGTTSNVIALFKDGTFTSDIGYTFSAGVAASKRKNPKNWGQWRMRNNELELKEYDQAQFEEASDWLTEPASKDLKLNGCYGNITSSSYSGYGGGSTVGNASSWCFKSNGRFSHSKTGFANATGDVRGSTSSNKKSGGKYYLSDYTARFIYDDGTEVTTSFCFLNKKKTHIAINGKRLMGK